jgi:hypothetical protein
VQGTRPTASSFCPQALLSSLRAVARRPWAWPPDRIGRDRGAVSGASGGRSLGSHTMSESRLRSRCPAGPGPPAPPGPRSARAARARSRSAAAGPLTAPRGGPPPAGPYPPGRAGTRFKTPLVRVRGSGRPERCRPGAFSSPSRARDLRRTGRARIRSESARPAGRRLGPSAPGSSWSPPGPGPAQGDSDPLRLVVLVTWMGHDAPLDHISQSWLFKP